MLHCQPSVHILSQTRTRIVDCHHGTPLYCGNYLEEAFSPRTASSGRPAPRWQLSEVGLEEHFHRLDRNGIPGNITDIEPRVIQRLEMSSVTCTIEVPCSDDLHRGPSMPIPTCATSRSQQPHDEHHGWDRECTKKDGTKPERAGTGPVLRRKTSRRSAVNHLVSHVNGGMRHKNMRNRPSS